MIISLDFLTKLLHTISLQYSLIYILILYYLYIKCSIYFLVPKLFSYLYHIIFGFTKLLLCPHQQ
jgi:hypothetical protein